MGPPTLGMLITLGFVALVLGPIAFFMSVGLRPRLRQPEETGNYRNVRFLDDVAAIQRRLREIEQKLTSASPTEAPFAAGITPTAEVGDEASPATEAPAAEPTITPLRAPARLPSTTAEEPV